LPVLGDAGDAILDDEHRVDGPGEGELHGPPGLARGCELGGHHGAEHPDAVEVLDHPVAGLGHGLGLGGRVSAQGGVGAVVALFEGDVCFDVDVVSRAAGGEEGHDIADLAFEGHVDDAVAGFEVGGRRPALSGSPLGLPSVTSNSKTASCLRAGSR
jgi:hypothetical protein